jgi:cytochrome c oxidase subunit 1
MTGHHEEQSFLRKYVFSVDHKTIAKQYMITGLVMAVLGGYLAYVFRSQLAWPGEPVLGFGQVGENVYNSLVTMHGTIMIFWVAMPILLAGFGNFLIPLMVGTDDMAFPRLNMVSYWTFFASTVVLLLSFVVPGGAAAMGWTFYPPLSARPDLSGVIWGGHLWILAVALEFASMLMGGINFLTTVINRRAPGMTMFRLPLMVWMQISASVLFMFSVGPLVAGAFMLLLDRTVGTGFFAPAAGGDPLLWQHLFWFFGHPEVYVILLPGLGVVTEVLASMSRKTIFGYRAIVYSTIVAGLLSFIVWAHHQFISGINPHLAMPFSITTILISVPFAVFIFCCIATLWRGSIRFSTSMLFVIAVLAEFLLGGVTGIVNGSAAADIYMHDTYFVVAHFHYTLFPAVILAMFAGIYYWFPKMFGRMMNEPLGLVHFGLTAVFFNLTFLPQFALGMRGHHRRIPDPTGFEWLADMQDLNVLSTIGGIGLLLSQIPFVINFFYSLAAGRKAERNPWQATTLEWVPPSPPGHGNFDELPAVYRGPYEYSPPDAEEDWRPQHVPAGSG